METLRNLGIEFVYVGYITIPSAGNTECSSSVCLHFSARIIALVIMLSDSPCEKIEKWETFPILKEDRWLVRI